MTAKNLRIAPCGTWQEALHKLDVYGRKHVRDARKLPAKEAAEELKRIDRLGAT